MLGVVQQLLGRLGLRRSSRPLRHVHRTVTGPVFFDVEPTDVEACLAAYLDSTEPDPADARSIARMHHALPFWLSMGGGFMLRPDGELVGVDWEKPEALEHGAGGFDPNVLRAIASLKYPSIRRLAPVRRSEDLECPQCHGTGRVSLNGKEYENITCTCGGIGWVRAEDVVR